MRRGLSESWSSELEMLEKPGLPPGREGGVPFPVRTRGGGLLRASGGIKRTFECDESVHGSPHGFE